MKFLIKITILIALVTMCISQGIKDKCFMPVDQRDVDKMTSKGAGGKKDKNAQAQTCESNIKTKISELGLQNEDAWKKCQTSDKSPLEHGDLEHGQKLTSKNIPFPGKDACWKNNRYEKIFTWDDNRITDEDNYYNAIRLGTVAKKDKPENHLHYVRPEAYDTWKVKKAPTVMVTSAPLGDPKEVRTASLNADLKKYIFPAAFEAKTCSNLGAENADIPSGWFSRDDNSINADNRHAFWNAAIINNIGMGVQLTNFIEAKEAKSCKIKADLYYPLVKGEAKTYGDITVKCLSVTEKASYNVRELSLTQGKLTKSFTHY